MTSFQFELLLSIGQRYILYFFFWSGFLLVSTTFTLSILEYCLTCYLLPNFLTAQYVTNSNNIHTIWIRGKSLLCDFVGTSFHAQLWNDLPATVFSDRYDMGISRSKESVCFHLKDRQRTCNFSGVARIRRRR